MGCASLHCTLAARLPLRATAAIAAAASAHIQPARSLTPLPPPSSLLPLPSIQEHHTVDVHRVQPRVWVFDPTLGVLVDACDLASPPYVLEPCGD